MIPEVDTRTLNAIAGDAGAFPWQLDFVQRRALFLRLGEDDIQGASFLDERFRMQGRDGFWLPIESLVDAAAAVTPIAAPAYIFHIGHCGSTLLTRMLEQFANVQGLREPMILRSLASAGSELASPLSRVSAPSWNRFLLAVLKLLGRPFSSEKRVLTKATSICNNLIEPLLAGFADARIVLLHVPLESYLATLLKGSGGGLDGLLGAPARLQYLHSRLGDSSLRLHQMEQAEVLAMGWLAELARFEEIELRFRATAQIKRSNFEEILENPEIHTTAIAEHLHLPLKSDGAVPLLKSTVMATYAKSPDHAYSPADRDHDLDLSRRTFAPQIAQGLHWAEQMINRTPALQSLEPHFR